jgi:arabinose-5-phosphate isomerase
MALSRARGFRVKDFAQRHPGGELGRRLCTRVRDVMQRDNLPLARPGESMAAVISKITQGRCGLAIVQGSSGELLGVITDGDLRRALQKERDLLALPAECIMTRRPLTISEEALVVEAEKVMETQRVKALLAVNHFGKVSGVIEFFAK